MSELYSWIGTIICVLVTEFNSKNNLSREWKIGGQDGQGDEVQRYNYLCVLGQCNNNYKSPLHRRSQSVFYVPSVQI